MITGYMIVRDDFGRHDLRASTWTAPERGWPKKLSVVESDANFVLLVEKKNIFAQLLEDDFSVKHHCVLASDAAGYPSRPLRTFLRDFHLVSLRYLSTRMSYSG